MSYVPFFRGLALAGMAFGLAACCTSLPPPHRPPPPFGPGGPPPHARGHGGMPLPSTDFEEAVEACADELDLPPPSSGDRHAPPALTDDQHALLDACLGEQGFVPRSHPPEDEEDPA